MVLVVWDGQEADGGDDVGDRVELKRREMMMSSSFLQSER